MLYTLLYLNISHNACNAPDLHFEGPVHLMFIETLDLDFVECLADIVEDVFHVLDTYRETDEVGGDASLE